MIINANSLQLPIADKSVQCVVTSPPYWGLRDYGKINQIGLESSPEEYVESMLKVFSEVWRVLKDDGTLWLNLGDTFAGSWGGMSHEVNGKAKRMGTNNRPPQSFTTSKPKHGVKRYGPAVGRCKPKDLVGIPWRVAFALQAEGWYLRSDIIWAKPNPMPESVRDRPTRSHEYIFLLTKNRRYYYDHEAIKEPGSWDTESRQKRAKLGHKSMPTEKRNGIRPKKDKQRGHGRRHSGFNNRWDSMTKEEQCSVMRNKRSVWNVATKPYSGAHFATFPVDLIVPCIKAGSRENDIVFDVFGGSGTVKEAAERLGRRAVVTELNYEYCLLAKERCVSDQISMFLKG
jgi:DNA modification methylase